MTAGDPGDRAPARQVALEDAELVGLSWQDGHLCLALAGVPVVAAADAGSWVLSKARLVLGHAVVQADGGACVGRVERAEVRFAGQVQGSLRLPEGVDRPVALVLCLAHGDRLAVTASSWSLHAPPDAACVERYRC